MGDNNQQNHYYQQNQNQHVFQQQQFAQQQQYNQPYNQQYANQQHYAQQNQQYYDYPAADDDYEQDDFDNLAEIEREMNKSSSLNNFGEVNVDEAIINEFEQDKTKNKFLPAGAMPTTSSGALSAHAAEFWFPECRNCECCKGFKHGCVCCKGGVNTCNAATCVDAAFTQQVSSDLASRPPVTPTTSTSSAAYKVEGPRSEAPKARPAAAAAPSGGDICKYESSPGGCRFGASCRFRHTTPGGAGAAPSSSSSGYSNGPPPAVGGGKQQCMYFARGNCQYGDGCRFGHF